MRSHVISRRASLDVIEIVAYLSDRDLAAGEQFLQQFTEKCRYLTQFPLIGKAYPELQAGLRGVVLNRYIIFYTVTETEVTIIRVLRGARDLRSMFN